jgi:hypothetical protein
MGEGEVVPAQKEEVAAELVPLLRPRTGAVRFRGSMRDLFVEEFPLPLRGGEGDDIAPFTNSVQFGGHRRSEFS